MTELKPCPFCGDKESPHIHEHANSIEGDCHFVVECECGAIQHGYGKTDSTAIKRAIKAWNTRA